MVSFLEIKVGRQEMRKPQCQKISSVPALLLLCSLAAAVAFSTAPSVRKPRQRFHSTTVPDPYEKIEAESNFWHSVVRRDGKPPEDVSRLPCVPSLDVDGPLPPGAYQTLGNTAHEPIPSCLLTISVGSDEVDLSRMHRFIDCGLTTFQLKLSQVDVYGRLRAETPNSVLRGCHFVVPFSTPSTSVMAHPSIVRDTVLQSLRRTGGDSIDTLQVEYTKGSQYHLDVLDCLVDLQRDGLIRSIGGKNIPPKLLREAAACGFTIDSNQITLNLLDPTQYTRELRLACHDLRTKLLLSSPLAGGMLTNRYFQTRAEPPPWKMTPTERNYLVKAVSPWAKKHSQDYRWRVYQHVMMDTLGDVALKHRVSVASVALRWAMQLDHVASVVVACGLGELSDGRPFDRPKQLRQVFRFELDEEDMERLWDASGEELLKTLDFNPLDFENMTFEDMKEGYGDTRFLPNASKQKLWL